MSYPITPLPKADWQGAILPIGYTTWEYYDVAMQREHDGFSAGSYKDLTRVAWLNPSMWAELFLENKKNLLFELDTLIGNLNQYKNALEAEDFPTLCRLLDEGRKIKEEVDGK